MEIQVTQVLCTPMIKIYSLFVLPNMNIIWIKQIKMKPLILKYLWQSPKKGRGVRAVCPESMLFIMYNKNMNISNTAAAITDLKSSNILYFTSPFFFFQKEYLVFFSHLKVNMLDIAIHGCRSERILSLKSMKYNKGKAHECSTPHWETHDIWIDRQTVEYR